MADRPLAPKPLHYALFHTPLPVEFLAAKGRFIAAKWYAWKNAKNMSKRLTNRVALIRSTNQQQRHPQAQTLSVVLHNTCCPCAEHYTGDVDISAMPS